MNVTTKYAVHAPGIFGKICDTPDAALKLAASAICVPNKIEIMNKLKAGENVHWAYGFSECYIEVGTVKGI